ncbi:hypothetical protein BH09DEP1_BH09DEP1_2220 [soil metagenome]
MKIKLILLLIPLITMGALPPSSKKMRCGIVKGQVNAVKDCLDKGESPLRTWPAGGATPLMMAIRWNKGNVANLLAATNLTPQAHAENHSKQTPLHFAAEAGNNSMIIKLLQAGADLKHLDANMKTPLLAAIVSAHVHNSPQQICTIKLLLEAADYWLSPEEKQLKHLVLATQNKEMIDLLEPYFFKQKLV